MDCVGCHTGGALAGAPDPKLRLAGSDIGFGAPGLGVFYPPNLTPDQETGLGAWSEADIVKALRTGERPDGRELAPMMPWRSYAEPHRGRRAGPGRLPQEPAAGPPPGPAAGRPGPEGHGPVPRRHHAGRLIAGYGLTPSTPRSIDSAMAL